MTQIFRGGGSGAAIQARQEQRVANDRQLAELNRAESRAALSRRNPRGRRLFSDAAAGEERSSTLA